MKTKKFSNELKEKIIEEVEQVKNVAAVARKNQLPISTVHTWIRKSQKKINYSNISKDDSLASENKNLKKQLHEKDLENQILKDLLKKTYQVWPTN